MELISGSGAPTDWMLATSPAKNVVAQEIAEAEDAPDDHVFELAQTAAFTGQPLGRPILGDPAVVNAATPQALGAWRMGLYAPDRLVVAASGAVDEDELLRLAEASFGDAAGLVSTRARSGTLRRRPAPGVPQAGAGAPGLSCCPRPAPATTTIS